MSCSIAFETLVAEQFEPVRMFAAGQEFAGAFADAFGPVAAWEATVVEVELEQFQVVRPQMAAQKEVTTQSAIEYRRAGMARTVWRASSRTAC